MTALQVCLARASQPIQCPYCKPPPGWNSRNLKHYLWPNPPRAVLTPHNPVKLLKLANPKPASPTHPASPILFLENHNRGSDQSSLVSFCFLTHPVLPLVALSGLPHLWVLQRKLYGSYFQVLHELIKTHSRYYHPAYLTYMQSTSCEMLG